MNITSKYSHYIFPIHFILLFAGTAAALPTASHDTLRGEMYVSSTANWPSNPAISIPQLRAMVQEELFQFGDS